MSSSLGPRGRLAVALVMSCAACSQSSDLSQMRPQGSDPPAVAAALSLGGRLSQDPAGKYQNAVNCASALRLTADRVAPMATEGNAQAIEAVRQAASYYRDRAVESKQGENAEAVVDSAIAQQLRDKRHDAAAEAQLSLACLRALQVKA